MFYSATRKQPLLMSNKTLMRAFYTLDNSGIAIIAVTTLLLGAMAFHIGLNECIFGITAICGIAGFKIGQLWEKSSQKVACGN